jgi:hypothetical protein
MGLSSSKSKSTTTTTPYGPATAAINSGLQAAQQVFDTQQPLLQQNAALAQQAYQSLAPQVFQTSPYVAAAQQAAQGISGGAYLGQNPGAATYGAIQSGTNPALGTLSGIANHGYANPADATASAIAAGKYLNGQPSSQFYSDVLGGKYLKGNPYLDAMVQQSDDAVTKAANQRFAAAGMGAGLSTPYMNVLTKNLADSENSLRYKDYDNEMNRMVSVGAQSDAAYGGERNRMDAANGLVAADYNTGQANKLAAATALGQQYNADAATRLNAAQAADGAQNSQIQQILSALALTPELSNAQYAGVAPALSLLTTASQIPYYGLSAYSGALDSLAGKYGTSSTKTSTTPSLFDQLQSGIDFKTKLSGILK